MPTMRMIQLAVPSRFELYIASHLFFKKSEWYFIVSVYDLICNVLGAKKNTSKPGFEEKKKGRQADSFLSVCAYLKIPCRWKIKH